jgi:DDE superfamily endonuclease
VAYEIALYIIESKIVWVAGPIKGGVPDLKIFKQPGGLKSKIPHNHKLIGDKGYVGDENVSTTNELDSRDVKEFKKRVRARHETVNERIKAFSVLSERFRHRLSWHQIAFEAVCVIVQYSFENGSELFDIYTTC